MFGKADTAKTVKIQVSAQAYRPCASAFIKLLDELSDSTDNQAVLDIVKQARDKAHEGDYDNAFVLFLRARDLLSEDKIERLRR